MSGFPKLFIVGLSLVFTFCAGFARSGESHGQVFLKLIYFNNPSGVGNNGHICEGKNFMRLFTIDECDHYFEVTLESFKGRHLAQKKTPAIDNKRRIHFGSRIHKMPNPLRFRVKLMNNFHIKIRVLDEDKNSNDFVGVFVSSIPTLTVGRNGNQPASLPPARLLRGNRGLLLQFNVWGVCDKHYYGLNCDVMCVPQDSDRSGHFSCNQLTGAKICRKGFFGKKCLQKDYCSSEPCQNNAKCLNTDSQFICNCTRGFKGHRCEEPVNHCEPSPCKNGASCAVVDGSPRCECSRGFIGAFCDQDLDECYQAEPCLNNATCHNTQGSYRCVCPVGFSGPRCEVRPVRHLSAAPAVASVKQSGNSLDESEEDGQNWPYFVAATVAGLIAVICLALMITLYRRRRIIVIKEPNRQQSVSYSTTPQEPLEANVYNTDDDSDGTLYEDIDRHLEERARRQANEEGEDSDGELPSDFANASYGDFSSREEV